MADFEQSDAAREAMQDSARDALYDRIQSGPTKALAVALGVSQRTVERWRAFISGSGSQARNPEKALPKVAALKDARLSFKGIVYIGGDPRYKRTFDVTETVPGQTLIDALNDPDAAWQALWDAYVVPDSAVDEIDELHFEL